MIFQWKNFQKRGVNKLKVIRYNSSEITAKNFSDYVNTENKTLTPKTHGRYDLKKTHWWIVPGTDWPMHNFGKYIFKEEGSIIKAGITVEKGLGEDTANVAPSELLMNASWQWFKFKEDLESGVVKERINKVKDQVDDLLLEIGLEKVSDPPNYDPHYYKDEKYIYQLNEDGKANFAEEKSKTGEYSQFTDLEFVSQLADMVENMDGKDWVWIDFDIVVPLKKKSEAEEAEELLSEFHLGAILQPLSRWIA